MERIFIRSSYLIYCSRVSMIVLSCNTAKLRKVVCQVYTRFHFEINVYNYPTFIQVSKDLAEFNPEAPVKRALAKYIRLNLRLSASLEEFKASSGFEDVADMVANLEIDDE